MSGVDTPPRERNARETVRFYLLDHRTRLGKAIDVGLLGLNLAFVLVYALQTYPAGRATRDLLWGVEVAIAVVFAVEYALRLYGAESRVDEATNPYTVVDLVAILPTFALVAFPEAALVLDVGFLRVLRVVRVLRFYRFTRDAEFFFGTVSDNALRAMKLLLTLFVLFFVVAGLFHSVEHDSNPAVGTFGDAFYFTVVTLTTVGYGDITPATGLGRGVALTGILTGILVLPWQASKIIREWLHRGKVNVTCPNCGLAYHDRDASHCKACGHVIYQEYDSRGS